MALPAHDLDHAPEDLVGRVRVFPLLVGGMGWSDVRELVDAARKLVRPAGAVRVGLVALPGGVAARVAKELTDGDVAGGPAREALETLGHLGVQLDLACLDQLHDRERRQACGDRAREERGVRRDACLAAQPGDTSPTGRGDLAVGHDGVRQSGRVRRRHLCVNDIWGASPGALMGRAVITPRAIVAITVRTRPSSPGLCARRARWGARQVRPGAYAGRWPPAAARP